MKKLIKNDKKAQDIIKMLESLDLMEQLYYELNNDTENLGGPKILRRFKKKHPNVEIKLKLYTNTKKEGENEQSSEGEK